MTIATDLTVGHSAAKPEAAGRVLVQPGRNAFPDMVRFIAKTFGFDVLELLGKDVPPENVAIMQNHLAAFEAVYNGLLTAGAAANQPH